MAKIIIYSDKQNELIREKNREMKIKGKKNR